MSVATSFDAEVIVVGAGHNGLICAAYLARSGFDTLLVEARSTVGGCASTVEDLGARFNICNCDHNLIRAMPVMDELDLASHGLRYLENEAGYVQAFHDDSDPWLFFHEIERTLDEIAAVHPSQVEGYRRYLDDAMPVAELVVSMAQTTPSVGELASSGVRRAAAGPRLLEWSRRSAADVLSDYFSAWQVWMPAISSGPTVWGAPPTAPGTGLAAAVYATRHLVRTGRPEGGSGALTDAVRASFEAAGGRVRCDARVQRVLVDGEDVGGIELTTGERLTASVVVAACDPHRVLVDWIAEPPTAARRLVEEYRGRPVDDGYESKVDAVLSGLPRHRFADQIEARHPGVDLLGPTTVVSPSPDRLAEAHTLRQSGRVASQPTLLTNIPSTLDRAMVGTDAPADRHVLSLEVLFTPYDLVGGWANSSEPERWIDLWADLMEPGARDLITDWRAMTPDRYEREFSMHRGHTPAYAASPLATLAGRDPELSRYRTPIGGLYLTGAGTFPGAGIFGASGRNAADVVRRDLESSLWANAHRLSRRARSLVFSLGERFGEARR